MLHLSKHIETEGKGKRTGLKELQIRISSKIQCKPQEHVVSKQIQSKSRL